MSIAQEQKNLQEALEGVIDSVDRKYVRQIQKVPCVIVNYV